MVHIFLYFGMLVSSTNVPKPYTYLVQKNTTPYQSCRAPKIHVL
jgi:hypothetical protein